MANTKLYGKDLAEYDDINIDELLETLTPEQIEELGQELIDPDDSHIPPSERCRYKTEKEPTGTYDRKHLIDHLETTAKEEKDWDEVKPFAKEVRGKVWKPKEQEKIVIDEDDVDTEWDEVLANATEEELVDLAAILGFHGMLNQVQYHRAFIDTDAKETAAVEEDEDEDEDEEDEDKKKKVKGSGFQGVAKHQEFKLVKEEPPNNTNVEESLEKLKANDPELKELNLNNIKNISLHRLREFAEALKTNTVLESISLAATKSTDRVGKAFAEALKVNKTLTTFNIESNYITGPVILSLLQAISENQTIIEFRVANQRPQLLGNKVETEVADIVQYNYTLLKFGIFLEIPGARVRLQEYLQRNNDALRQERMGQPTPDRVARPVKVFKKRETAENGEAPRLGAKKAPPPKEEESEEEESEEEESDEE